MPTTKKKAKTIDPAQPVATYLTVQQVARIYQISPRNVRRRCAVGQLPAPIRIGRLVRWRPADLKAWDSDPNRAA